MIIIGEKINGTIPGVKSAIQERDKEYIVDLAVRQAEAGADYIDICAGTTPEVEIETLTWLMEIVQGTVEKPLCIDSPNPKAIEAVFDKAKVPGIINSVSGEEGKCEVIFPLVQGTEWEVIALTCDSSGIPSDIENRVEITKHIIYKAQKYGIDPSRLHIDPLVMALATDNSSFVKFLNTMKQIKKLYPSAKITSGLSNISFGMPLRKAANQSFLTIALYAGMDSAIMDPCNKEMMAALFSTEALLGRDKFCRNYNKAYRKGIIKY